MSEQSTACWLTPPGRSAIATVAVWGPNAAADVETQFHSATGKRLRNLPPGAVAFGRWGAAGGEELVISVRENGVEIHCHGGRAAAQAILDSLAGSVRIADSTSPWLAREFPDPIEREIYAALPLAATSEAATRLLAQAGGTLQRHIDQLREQSASDRAAAREAIETTLREAEFGRRLTTPWRVILTGPPNVGKSSLINRIAGYDRAVVYDQPGTTRDVVSVVSPLAGWAVVWSDTAGIRESDDSLEQEGVRRARAALGAADLVITVVDATEPKTSVPPPTAAGIVAVNKIDAAEDSPATFDAFPPHAIPVSATTGQGIERLLQAVTEQLVGAAPQAIDHPLLFTPRQIEQVRQLLH